jgi:membrane protease subunit HflC
MLWKAVGLVVVLVALAAVPSALFTVDRAEFVYVTQFGRRVAVYDGADDAQAGLHVKWPWPVESVQRLDRRLQYFDLPGAELLTRAEQGNSVDKTLTLDAYVCWRIANAEGADQFIRSIGTAERAQLVLGQRIASELGSAVAAMELSDLIAPDAGRIDQKREALRQRLLEGGSQSLRQTARVEYGIEVVDVRLRRSNHPASVREAIFERIRSEREERAMVYKTEGKTKAKLIGIETDNTIKKERIAAENEAAALRGQAAADALNILSAPQNKDPQYYAFWLEMESLKAILGDGKSLVLLSLRQKLLDRFRNPPAPANKALMGPPAPR